MVRLPYRGKSEPPDTSNTPTKIEADLMAKWDLNLSQIRGIREQAKGLCLTLDTACHLNSTGELDRMVKEKEDDTHVLVNIENMLNTIDTVKVSKHSVKDDVSKLLSAYNTIEDLEEILISSGCKEEQIQRLVYDVETGKVNRGIIRMRAGNMLRHALLRKQI